MAGFILLEAMLALAVFVLAVLGFAACVRNCIEAEMYKEEDSRARRFLAGRMAEIESAMRPAKKNSSEDLKESDDRDLDEGAYAGMHLVTKSVLLKAKNELEEEITGVYDVTLTLTWRSGTGEVAKSLEFFVYPKPEGLNSLR